MIDRPLEEGHQVNIVRDSDPDRSDKLLASGDELWDEEAQAVSSAADISEKEFNALQEKRSRTSQESRRLEEKFAQWLRKGVEVTPVLKKLHDKRWHSQILLHYLLTCDPRYLERRDRQHFRQQVEPAEGQIHLPDLWLLPAQIAILKPFNCKQFADPDREWRATEPEVIEFVSQLVKDRRDIKAVLNLTVSPELAEKSPIRII